MVSDEDDSILIGGYTGGSMSTSNIGWFDFWVTKLDLQGTTLWSLQVGRPVSISSPIYLVTLLFRAPGTPNK